MAHEERLYHRLQLAAHLARKHADRAVAAATGLTVAQVAVLNVVAAGQGVTQRDVAAALGINESAVTAMVRRLVDAEFLTRTAADGRTRKLTLTGQGTSALAKSRRAFAPVNALLAGGLTGDEVRELAARLEELAVRLG